jgi:VanZ family protein
VPKKTTIFSATVFYTIAVTVLSLVNLGNKLPKLNSGFDDKIAHFLLYAIFCLMWFFTFKSLDLKRSLFIALCLSILFGMAIELIQGLDFIGRTSDAYDFMANVMGAMSMAALIYTKNKVAIKKM